MPSAYALVPIAHTLTPYPPPFQAQERAQAQLAVLDTQYQAKIMAEVERYQALVPEKELLNERWDEQNGLLVDSHERVIAELTEDYEAKLAEEALKIEQLQVGEGGGWRGYRAVPGGGREGGGG